MEYKVNNTNQTTIYKCHQNKYTSSHPIPYAKGFIFILMKRYVYPSHAQASFTFVTVPNVTSAFKLSFKEVMNCQESKITYKYLNALMWNLVINKHELCGIHLKPKKRAFLEYATTKIHTLQLWVRLFDWTSGYLTFYGKLTCQKS